MLRLPQSVTPLRNKLASSKMTPFANLATVSRSKPPRNKYSNEGNAKRGGDISDAFASMSSTVGSTPGELPPRFAALKRELVQSESARQEVVKAWKEVIDGLDGVTKDIAEKGGKVIPQVQFESIANGTVTAKELKAIKTVGTVIIKNAVPKEEALSWKADIQTYTKDNKELARGFPASNPQVWEFYHSKSQIQARTHPNVLGSPAYLLKLWHASEQSEVDFETPLCYFDRLRIRWPGDSKFALGPHIDGGSVERWEDPVYRKCFDKLLTAQWKEHDPFDGTHRIGANMDMYKGQGSCNMFRPWQGWLSMSTTAKNEGTLQVFPNLHFSSAYTVLRPFFKSITPPPTSASAEEKSAYLAPSNWALDLTSSAFPNSIPGHAQELNDETHPHLRLASTMTSMPFVEPGDQVYWHCDVIHAVEKTNAGKGDSSVMYIPAVPLTVNNAEYLAAQRQSFLVGYPPYDFSGGEGEAKFVNRATEEDIYDSDTAKRAMGFKEFIAYGVRSGEQEVVKKANVWLST